MSKQRFASIWDAIEDTPEEAENMKLRSTLMMALKKHITLSGVSQAQAAKLYQLIRLGRASEYGDGCRTAH